jgi:hypothetical protein
LTLEEGEDEWHDRERKVLECHDESIGLP